jgi:hypothetical protein
VNCLREMVLTRHLILKPKSPLAHLTVNPRIYLCTHVGCHPHIILAIWSRDLLPSNIILLPLNALLVLWSTKKEREVFIRQVLETESLCWGYIISLIHRLVVLVFDTTSYSYFRAPLNKDILSQSYSQSVAALVRHLQTSFKDSQQSCKGA